MRKHVTLRRGNVLSPGGAKERLGAAQSDEN